MKRLRFIAAFMAMIIWCPAVMVYAEEPTEAPTVVAGEEAVAQENEAVAQEEEATTQENEATTQEEEAATQEEATAVQENEEAEQENEAATQEEATAVQENEEAEQENEAATQEEEASVQEEEAAAQENKAAVQEEEAAVQENEEAEQEEEEIAQENEEAEQENEEAETEDEETEPEEEAVAAENEADMLGDEEAEPEEEEVLSPDWTYEDIYRRKFDDSGKGLIITGLKTAETINNPVIPSKMKSTTDGDDSEYTVIGIEEKAFNGRGNLTGTLTIPEGIQKIGLGAFWGCFNLTGTVTIPSTVTQLGYHVSDGSEVAVIDTDDPDWNDPSGNVFSGCDGITEFVNKTDCLLYLPDLRDPLETFDKYEWVNAADSSIIKNNRIRKGTAVKKEYKTIDKGSFKYRYLDGGKIATVQGLADKLTYADNPSFPATIANNPVTGIESYSFQGQKGLAGTLTLPEGITSIGNSAFVGCENLTGTLTIPATVTEIGDYAFNECEGFTGTVIFPSGLTKFGADAIDGCTGLTKVVNNSGCQIDLPDAGEGYEWVNDSGKKIFRIGKGTATKIRPEEGYVSDNFYKAAYNEDGTTLMIVGPVENTKYNPDPVIPKTIDGKAVTGICGFDGYDGLAGHITFPAGLTEIGYDAFKGCTGLTGTLELPGSLEEIKSYAFKECAGFTGTVTIPAGVKKIGTNPFDGCDGIEVIENKSGQAVYLPERTGYIWVDKDQKEINQIQNGTATRKIDPQYVTDGTFLAKITDDGNSAVIESLVDSTKTVAEITIPASIEGKKIIDGNNGYGSALFKHSIYITKIVNNSEQAFQLDERTGYVWDNNGGGTITRKYAEGTFDDGTYAAMLNEDGKTVTIVGLAAQGKEITDPKIPETMNGKAVTGIAYGAFSYCNGMKGTVTIPATVKNIDNGKITYQHNRDYTVFEGCDGITRFDNRSLRVLELPTIIGKTWVTGDGYEVIDKVRNGSAVRSDIKPKPPVNVPVAYVKITPKEKTISVKKSVTLTAKVTPANATNKKVTWASSNPSIAKVDQKGKVTAKAPGKVTITATAKDGSKAVGKAVIKVRGISSNTQKLVIKQSATNKKVKVTFVNDEYKKFTKTDKKKVLKSVKFDKRTGTLTIKANKKNGTATVNVKSKGGLTQKITVTVQGKNVTTTKITAKVNGKDIKKDKITLKKKKSTSVTVTATPDKISTGESITAKSTDNKIATVKYDKKTGTWKITAKNKAGTCKVKFTAGKKTKAITVQVKK